MKSIKLLAILLVLTIVSCTKKPVQQSITNVTPPTNIIAYGIYVNVTNQSDYFYLNSATNASNGEIRYILTHFQYKNNSPATDTILQSKFLTAPGNSTVFNSNGWWGALLYYTNNQFKLQLTDPNGVITNSLFTKQ